MYGTVEKGLCELCKKEQGITRLPFLFTSRICCKPCFDNAFPDEPAWSKSGTVSFAEHEAAKAGTTDWPPARNYGSKT